jgi:NitT/TauT family transport system substrate-binding protein
MITFVHPPATSPPKAGRRRFLRGISTLAALTAVSRTRHASAEPGPEVTHVRLAHNPAICLAPTYLAADLLRMEGFSRVEYTEASSVEELTHVVRDGRADFTQDTAPAVLPTLDGSRAITVLAGIHVGCYELFGGERVRTLSDLKGASIALTFIGAAEQVFISSVLAYVGLDPRHDVKWIPTGSFDGPAKLFAEGKSDAVLAFAPQPQELRRRKVGHVILDTAQDRPWSQYYCCMLVGGTDFITKYPIATKRVVRAYLKAADICSEQPERVARYLVEKGFEPRYDIGLEVLQKLPYNRWRDASPADTIRFHALRLHEVGMIRTPPNKLLAQGTDWRFLNELRKELKA